MKTCPSCGSELADDAKECLCGYSYEEGAEPESAEMEFEPEGADADAGDESAFAAPAFGEPAGAEMPSTKPCVFCLSEIAAPASRCPHCAGFLPIAEGTVFKQYFFFLFASLAIAIGCLLPWERTYELLNLRGVDSISGGLLFVLAVYAAISSIWNIYHRKMIVWPVLLAALDGLAFGGSRIWNVIAHAKVEIRAASEFGQFVENVRGHAQAAGPGLYLVVGFSLLVFLSFIVSVFQGAKQDAARKQADREARAAARKSRR